MDVPKLEYCSVLATAPPNMNREERHRQALDLISRREANGSPFFLYLRDFFGGDREGIVKSQYYTPDKRFAIDNTLIKQVSPQIGVLFVQSEKEESLWADKTGSSLGPSGASLRLPDTEWQEVVDRLIDLAELIFVDAPVLSAGTKFELELCLKKNRVHQTVLILSAPNFMRLGERSEPSDEANSLIQQFPRVVWSDDLHIDVAGDFVIKDLVERARAIADLPVEERVQLLRNMALSKSFPVKYTDVARQYIVRSAMRDVTRRPWNEDPWEDNWERTFWGFHRAVLTFHAMMQLGATDLEECVDRLIECYKAMVNLLAEAQISERGVVTRGHFELCVQLSSAAVNYARSSKTEGMLRICEEMLAESSKRAIQIKAENIPYYPILRTLYLPDQRRVFQA